MDKRRWSLVGFILALPIIAALWWMKPQPRLPEGQVILPDGTSVAVEIASTAPQRATGLSGRPDLSDGKGMLFLFGSPDIYPFYMRAMNFPIDIVWIMDDTVVFVAPNVSSALEDQLTNTVPNAQANRVLELPAGYSAAHRLEVGSTLDIHLPPG